MEKIRDKYVAFLRGINVGGHTLVKMDELRKAFESLGFRNVRTIMASGNVLFEAHEEDATVIAVTIAQKLDRTFGRKVAVIVRTLDELRELVDREPFKGVAPPARLFVTFLSKNSEHKKIPPWIGEDFRIISVRNGTICSILYEKPGVGAVHLMGAIEKEFGQEITTRSWDTVIRLLKASAT